ncbi:segregation and condensation protein A [Sneathia sanguinegens]|uniref:segregation and condensation protein A n=1 Tax=Sneathia sanguinegens TaxID=40543 RepID=UPI0008336586|nr:segregation/condensation protein A [Sneathia sanguinegens]MDU4651931.1 segregation/condensation protein A [Sneathia sanguinegens]
MHQIKIENFEGPFDLLLHLIEEKKIDIKTIKISNVIDDYLEVIYKYEKNNLKVKVEFLQMASILLEIKAYSIIRKKNSDINATKLEQKLKEYKLFKEIASIFLENENEFYKSFSKNTGEDYMQDIIEHDNTRLTKENINICLNDIVLRLLGTKDSMKIDVNDDFTVDDAKENILNLPNNRLISFKEILNNKYSKKRIVIFFITILELYKNNLIDLIIDNNEFYIKKGNNV